MKQRAHGSLMVCKCKEESLVLPKSTLLTLY